MLRQSLVCTILAGGMAGAVSCGNLQASLPRTDGEVALEGLTAPVEVQRDAFSIVRIVGEGFEDVARAQGYVHAQDRFFQMDLMRRSASGRLSELLGTPTVAMDLLARPHGFTEVAAGVLHRLPEKHRDWLEAYSEGVNAGLADLGALPPEYVMLGVAPQAWDAKDSILVLQTMNSNLVSGERAERVRTDISEVLGPEMLALLTPDRTRFDAPMDADACDPAGGYTPAPIPGPDVLDLRREVSHLPAWDQLFIAESDVVPGSNSWAVAGSRTVHGGAIVANDMHLSLSLPNIWYRVQMEWPDRDGDGELGTLRVVGVSLPGVPGIVTGTSGQLAWGFTNTEGDLVDLVRVEVDPQDEDRYRVGAGWERFETRTERVAVRGADELELEVRVTRWGPLTEPAGDGTALALRWSALDPENTNLRLLDLPWARTLEEGLEIMREWMGPPQNALLADRHGDIAWTVAGYLPVRRGFDGRVSVSWADGDVGWDGSLEGDSRPQIIRPASGRLFTANNRVYAGQGDSDGSLSYGSGFANGSRAQRIRELLDEDKPWDEAAVFGVALDTRVRLMDRYRAYAGSVLAEEAADDEAVARALDLLVAWNGTADADQPGYRLLREYRSRVHRAVLGPMIDRVQQERPGFRYVWYGGDETVLRLLEERPAHLLNPAYTDWDELLARVFVGMVRDLGPGAGGGIETPWGELNRAAISHPAAMVAPGGASEALRAPRNPMSGDAWAVRVARPGFGASERFAISPGREEAGLLHMPGGQSGHPLSPHFQDQHRAWLSGQPLPLLTGEAVGTVRLVPPPNGEE